MTEREIERDEGVLQAFPNLSILQFIAERMMSKLRNKLRCDTIE